MQTRFYARTDVLAKPAAEREAQARADLPTLPPFTRTARPVNCDRCGSRVFASAATPDGARHYCRCIRAIA
jgi:DNA-directed RNA polymerase subunit RPC12/RpoP